MITEILNLIEQPMTALSPLSMSQGAVTNPLRSENETQVLRFLAERPLHNAVMSGLIRDNGIESKFNRGTFYGYRDMANGLLGVALIGHAVFIDARCDEALRQFAKLAQEFPRAHMLMGEQEMIERFWKYYAPNGQPRHRICREVLFELNEQTAASDDVANLRLAEVSDLSLVVPVHATMAFEESGVNPLEVDPEGFRQRCRRRIEERRTWVLVEQDQLIFKADIVSDTPDVVYLEGVYVHPEYRGKGHGSRCLTQLTRSLLNQTRSISLLVNQERRPAQEFFKNLGFASRGLYDTIFLRTQTELS
jgi:predicted GNAT family acetyltransferase